MARNPRDAFRALTVTKSAAIFGPDRDRVLAVVMEDMFGIRPKSRPETAGSEPEAPKKEDT